MMDGRQNSRIVLYILIDGHLKHPHNESVIMQKLVIPIGYEFKDNIDWSWIYNVASEYHQSNMLSVYARISHRDKY